MMLKILSLCLPWPVRRYLLIKWFKYEIHPQARIGLAWVFPKKLIMAKNARIDHFTVAINLDKIEMKPDSTIGRSNWITGFPTGYKSGHFQHQPERIAALLLGESAAITKNHHIDCTNQIVVGRFATIAGYNSQFLTHSVDIYKSIQHSSPIIIGEYSFVGTNVVVLGGAVLPPRSVLGAKSLLNKALENENTLYGGVPAEALKEIPKDAMYFKRTEGFIY